MALLECLARVAPRLGVQLEVATVHHGRAQSDEVVKARARAFHVVKKMAAKHGLVFHGVRRGLRLAALTRGPAGSVLVTGALLPMLCTSIRPSGFKQRFAVSK